MMAQSISRNRPLIVTSLGHFTNDGTVFLIPVIIDMLAVLYSVNTILITISLTLFYLSTALSANILGPAIDRRGAPAKGMFYGILVLSIGLLLFAVAVDGIMVPYFVVISSVVAGTGASFYHPTGSAILQDYYKGDRLGRYLGINGSAGSFGRALYPSLLLLVGVAFASNTDSVIFFGSLGIFFSFMIYLGVREYEKRRKENPASGGHKSDAEQDPAASNKGKKESFLTGGIVFLTAISLVRNLAFTGIISWVPEFISFERGVGGDVSLGIIMTIMFAGGILGQLVFGKLVEDHDKRVILTFSTIASATLMFLYIYFVGSFSLVFLAMFGFFNFSGFPIFMSMVSDYVPRGSSTSSNALVWNLGGTGGRTVGPLVVGALMAGSYSKLPFAFEILLLIGVASALMALKLPKPAKVSRASVFG